MPALLFFLIVLSSIASANPTRERIEVSAEFPPPATYAQVEVFFKTLGVRRPANLPNEVNLSTRFKAPRRAPPGAAYAVVSDLETFPDVPALVIEPANVLVVEDVLRLLEIQALVPRDARDERRYRVRGWSRLGGRLTSAVLKELLAAGVAPIVQTDGRGIGDVVNVVGYDATDFVVRDGAESRSVPEARLAPRILYAYKVLGAAIVPRP